MIRTILTPQQRSISINIPENFLGRQVEVIIFTIDEAVEEQNISEKSLNYLASEMVLSKNWLSSEEDRAWQDL